MKVRRGDEVIVEGGVTAFVIRPPFRRDGNWYIGIEFDNEIGLARREWGLERNEHEPKWILEERDNGNS